ncbi:hypothetical protein MF271_22750 (plasmid) [Deinococcus sp. KNUC1210]|uniref:hypothetical protein n=1 Tax=Deinococcus sp. KNUC1210 TaxID=2917691 RepID=UPI001EEFC99F|nr:hypothetical protein [Deinococcus sp. KNUC1210]ULH18285.1 hypothetical protein MF271_22750 [Deinococcus sp. KNUC1210]
MTLLLYPITPETFPRTGTVDIPCCTVASYDGNTAILQPKGMTVPFDFSALTPEEFQLATQKNRRDLVEIRGLVALETHWMLDLQNVTFRPPYRKPLGVKMGGIWYFAWPPRWDGTLGIGAHTVITLVR